LNGGPASLGLPPTRVADRRFAKFLLRWSEEIRTLGNVDKHHVQKVQGCEQEVKETEPQCIRSQANKRRDPRFQEWNVARFTLDRYLKHFKIKKGDQTADYVCPFTKRPAQPRE
jgi:hypothetical protein